MKFIFNMAAVAALASTLACRPPQPATAPPPADGSDVQRLVALLDYIASDYGGAVENGRIVNPDEYVEQQKFVQDAQSIAASLLQKREGVAEVREDALARELERLSGLVSGQAEAAQVAAACHGIKTATVERFGLRTSPAGRPSLERARVLYTENCAVCHGAGGKADTPRARELNPAPVNFRDPAIRANLSPYRIYNTLTFGVSGTSMASFETLPSDDRWSLAFFALSLAHADGARDAVETAVPMSDLASLSDQELTAELAAQGQSAPARRLAYLRTKAPFEPPSVATGIAETRARLRRAITACDAGRPVDADRFVLDAYLQGFDPMEAHFRGRDPQGTAAIEQEFQSIRSDLARGAAPQAVRARLQSLDRRLAGLAEPTPTMFPFVAAALIYLREGVEAALLVGALLAAVRRLGQPDAARYIHRGWIAALVAGVATWWMFGHLIALGAAQRELVEAGTALAAAAVLFWVSFWLISKAESRRWMEYLRRNVAESLSRGNLLVLGSMAFLAVYREAAETVLFTQVLLQDAPGAHGQVWAGAVLGVVLTVAVAIVMRRAVSSLPLGPFFTVSGALLCLLSISFAGSGLYTLVSAGYLSPRPVSFPEVRWLGVHPDLNGLLLQAAILLAVGLTGLAAWTRAARHEEAQ